MIPARSRGRRAGLRGVASLLLVGQAVEHAPRAGQHDDGDHEGGDHQQRARFRHPHGRRRGPRLLPRGRDSVAKGLALGTSVLTFAVSLPLWFGFNSAEGALVMTLSGIAGPSVLRYRHSS